MEEINFWFSIGSTYTYLTVNRLHEVAEKENIKVENDDFSQVIMNEAMQTGQKPEKLVKELRKDQDRINKMRTDILLSKAMDLLIEKSVQANTDTAD